MCKGKLLKNGAWTVYRFKGELGATEGVVFLRGVDNPMHTYESSIWLVNFPSL